MKNILRLVFLLLLTTIPAGLLIRYWLKPPVIRPVPEQSAFVTEISAMETYQQLASQPLVAKYNGVSSVKLVYDLQTNELYFVNGKRFRFHYDFCREILGYRQGLEVFNQANYGQTPLRAYVLANLNYYPEQDLFAVEFVTEDDVRATQIEDLFARLREKVISDRPLKLLLNGEKVEQVSAKLQGIGFIMPADIYANLTYQLIEPGTAYGTLVFASAASLREIKNNDCILVIKDNPIYIPPCQGILCEQFQTPLSHIQILSHHLKLPSCASKKLNEESFKKLANQLVKITISTDSFHIEPIDRQTYLQHKKPLQVPIVNLHPDVNERALISLNNCHEKDKNSIGHKAWNLSVLQKISTAHKHLFKTPEGGFAIPFYYYRQHMQTPIIQQQLQLIISKHNQWNQDTLQRALKTLRQMICAEKINPELLQMVAARIRQNNVGTSYRFRSSSNAEDVAGFSGAGIYTSKTGILNDQQKSIEKAIKKVWASTWRFEAFMAREQAGISHREVMMGILCHKNFGNEDANGVVVTRNIYRPSFPGYTVNVQKGEIPVVAPESEVICDQFTVFNANDFNPFSDLIATDYITTGNRNRGKKVLNNTQTKQLFSAVQTCVQYFEEELLLNGTYDLEFKFLNGQLYLKQIRPYD